MKRYSTSLILLLLLMVSEGQGQKFHPTEEEWDEAAKNVTGLSPMEFEGVPAEVQRILSEEGCTIPQIPRIRTNKKYSLISGEFAVKGQTDWAALCSRDGSSTIVVLWGGPVLCRSWLEKRPHLNSLQTGITGHRDDKGEYTVGIIFDRSIFTYPATSRVLWEMDEGLPAERTHDSIGDGIHGKAATAYYCHEGQWIEFGVAD